VPAALRPNRARTGRHRGEAGTRGAAPLPPSRRPLTGGRARRLRLVRAGWRCSGREDGGVFGYVVLGRARGVGCAAGAKRWESLSPRGLPRLVGAAAPALPAAGGPCLRPPRLPGPALGAGPLWCAACRVAGLRSRGLWGCRCPSRLLGLLQACQSGFAGFRACVGCVRPANGAA